MSSRSLKKRQESSQALLPLTSNRCLASQRDRNQNDVAKTEWKPPCKYFPETDTLSITVAPGIIEMSDEVLPGLLIDYTAGNKIVAVAIWTASSRFPIELYEDAEDGGSKPPLRFRPEHQGREGLTIALLDSPSVDNPIGTYDERITVWEDEAGRWTKITISNAPEAIV